MLQKKNRIDTLQILRAIAFLEIFLGHCGISFFTGAFGVSIFIVLSGFCMSLNYLPKTETISLSPISNVKYAVSKVKKLYVLHLIMLFCAFLLAQTPTSAEAMKRLVMDILLVQSWSPHSADFFSYNGVAWYLSAYFFICICSLYVMKLVSKLKDRRMVILVSVVVYIVMLAIGIYVSRTTILVGDNFAFWLTYISPVYRILEFFLGAALGWLYLNRDVKNTPNKARDSVVEAIATVLFIGVICVFHKMEGVYDGICYTALFTPVSILLVLVFACSKGFVVKIMNHRFFLWLGNLSTYTFLIHQVVIRWLRNVLTENYSGEHYILVLTILSFGVTAAAAMIVQYLGKLKINNNTSDIN